MTHQITSEFSHKFIPVNRFQIAAVLQKLHSFFLLQITEDGVDQGGEN